MARITCSHHRRGKAVERNCLFLCASFSPSLWFMLLWRQITNYYRRCSRQSQEHAVNTGILNRYKSIKSLSLEHEPHCCEAGHRAGARADLHTGCCPGSVPSIPHHSHYRPAVDCNFIYLIIYLKGGRKKQTNTKQHCFAHFTIFLIFPSITA